MVSRSKSVQNHKCLYAVMFHRAKVFSCVLMERKCIWYSRTVVRLLNGCVGGLVDLSGRFMIHKYSQILILECR